MVSNASKELCSYYKNHFDLTFKEIEIKNERCFFSCQQPLVILESAHFNQTNLSCGLAICGNDLEDKNHSSFKTTTIGNISFLLGHFLLPPSFIEDLIPAPHLKNKKNWIHVLRSADIEEAKNFYAPLGEWEMEKHGEGPLHYSRIDHSTVFELYPYGKNSTKKGQGFLEYLIPTHHPLPTKTDLEGRIIRFTPSFY